MVDARQATTIARIVKVNHGGEFGAIKIYQAQIGLARRRYPDLAAALEAILTNEKRHCAVFYQAMISRDSRPCRLMGLWGLGGLLLGFSTALLGRQAILICTSAVEHAVHRHMADQLDFLAHCDPELCAIVEDIQRDELEHLRVADSQMHSASFVRTILYPLVFAATDILIFLSTSGDSRRIRRAIKPR